MESIESEINWFETEEIPEKVAMGEFMMMGLRLKNGVSRENFKKLFGATIESVFDTQLQEAAKKGFLDYSKLALTEKGRLFSNQVITTFFT